MALCIAILCLFNCIAQQPNHGNAAISVYKSRYDEFKNRRFTNNMSIVTNVKVTNAKGVKQTRSTFARLNDEFVFAEEQIKRIPNTPAIFPIFYTRNNMYAFELKDGKNGEKIAKSIIIPSPSLQHAVDSLSNNVREACKMKLGMIPIPSPKYSSSYMYYFMEIDLIAELPSLNIVRCNENGRFIDVEFTYSHLDPIKKVPTQAEGKATLDANRDCRCIKYFSKYSNGEYNYTVNANVDINSNNGHEVVKITSRRTAIFEGKKNRF